MTKRHRTPPHTGEFNDPLSNYDPLDYTDALEKSLCEDPATAIESTPFGHVTPTTSVRETLRMMLERDAACMVVVSSGKPVGIVSERDVLMRIADRYDELADAPVSRVMTPDPVVVNVTDSPARVLNQMGSGMFRHLPVVDVDGRLIGVIGARRVTAYLQKHFANEAAK
ncbi:MAG: CBS domain-containing protein [Planctomycetes bacterium]|nr:CBS domain-containing protein [Planctomycetota bacterium]